MQVKSVNAYLCPAHPNNMNINIYNPRVDKCAVSVPFGMALMGSLRLLEELAPVRIPVQALKNSACKL